MKKIPYGISNFRMLRKENYLYVDKTKYIQLLEEYPPYQFFIRPRRFGKSLFVSMLDAYYDMNSDKEFEELFGNLYIGRNPTQKRNQYLILKISFAGIETGSGEEKLKESFSYKVKSAAQEFLDRYAAIIGEDKVPPDLHSAESVMEFIRRVAKKSGKQVFVLIDEYDNFANELITGGKKAAYENLMHGEGLVKAFFKTVKDATMDNFARLFMTGVSPIMLDDLTSGFNITDNLTLRNKLNSMLGFTEGEVVEILKNCNLYSPGILGDMKKYYNGYRFSPDIDVEHVYNSDMTLYFIKDVAENGRYPVNMIDNNVKTDYSRVNQLALNFRDRDTLERIIADGEIDTRLVERFNLSTMYSSKENFVSLLFYLGMLTIKEPFEDVLKLCIPNYVIKTLYWEQNFQAIQNELAFDSHDLKKHIRTMRLDGSISDFINLFKDILTGLSNRDLIGMNEKNIKMILMTLFGVDGTYMVSSEDEVTEGYIDILLTSKKQFVEHTNFEWMIELKYLKESEKERFEECKKEGLEQIIRYARSRSVKDSIDKKGLKEVLILVTGKNHVHYEVVAADML